MLWDENAQDSCLRELVKWMHKSLVGESLWNENAQEPCWREFVKWECTRTLLERAYEFQRLPSNFQLCSECDWNYILTAYASFGNVSYVLGHNSLLMFWWTQKLAYVLMETKPCLCFNVHGSCGSCSDGHKLSYVFLDIKGLLMLLTFWGLHFFRVTFFHGIMEDQTSWTMFPVFPLICSLQEVLERGKSSLLILCLSKAAKLCDKYQGLFVTLQEVMWLYCINLECLLVNCPIHNWLPSIVVPDQDQQLKIKSIVWRGQLIQAGTHNCIRELP
jgi:hypothetical protein